MKQHLEKIVVNTGIGRHAQMGEFKDKMLPEIIKELALIVGQKPVPAPAKKSIAGFKTRVGDIIGLKITLRKKRMEDFFSKLVNIVLPRVKDFRGLNRSIVDAGGNLNIGLRDQHVFPEIDQNTSKVNFGLQITVVPKVKNREKMLDFYRKMGVPLKSLDQESKPKAKDS